MNAPLIPLVDLNSWQTGDAETRRSVAAEVDQALQQSDSCSWPITESHPRWEPSCVLLPKSSSPFRPQ